MKNVLNRFLLLFVALVFASRMIAEGTGTVSPRYSTINGDYSFGGQPVVEVYDLLRTIGLEFSKDMVAKEDAYCSIMCDDVLVAKSRFENVSPHNTRLFACFDNIELPKGKYYKAVVPVGAFYEFDNPANTTAELSMEFYVPDYLTSDLGRMFVGKDACAFYFNINTEEFEGAHIKLFRNGNEIMRFQVYTPATDVVSSSASCTFGKSLYFEKGVNFTFVLPEGSVHSLYREDIINEEAKYEFLGTSDHVFTPIVHSALRVPSAALSSLGTVLVDYASPVQLAPEAKLQLVDAGGNVLKEAVAALSETDGTYTVVADFGGYTLDSQIDYSVCIPEATVVGTSSDITVNRRTLVPLSDATLSVGEVKTMEPRIEKRGSMLYVSGVEEGCRVAVYNASGVLVGTATVNATPFSMPLPHTGLLIVKVAGKAYKLK